MRFAGLALLPCQPNVVAKWEPCIALLAYDPRNMPAKRTAGIIIGMAMTARQCDSNVRTRTAGAIDRSACAG